MTKDGNLSCIVCNLGKTWNNSCSSTGSGHIAGMSFLGSSINRVWITGLLCWGAHSQGESAEEWEWGRERLKQGGTKEKLHELPWQLRTVLGEEGGRNYLLAPDQRFAPLGYKHPPSGLPMCEHLGGPQYHTGKPQIEAVWPEPHKISQCGNQWLGWKKWQKEITQDRRLRALRGAYGLHLVGEIYTAKGKSRLERSLCLQDDSDQKMLNPWQAAEAGTAKVLNCVYKFQKWAKVNNVYRKSNGMHEG